MSAQEVEVVEPEKKSKAIAKREPRALEAVHTKPSMEEVLMRAVDQGAPIETLERIAKMVEEAQARVAKAQFFEALARFQSLVPSIPKKKQGYGYLYAPLDAIDKAIKKAMEECGLSKRWLQVEGDDQVTISCVITHVGGHSEASTIGPVGWDLLEKTDRMNSLQHRGAVIKYLQRYTTVAALGLATADDDTDGISPQDARKAKTAPQPVRQPQQTPTAQKATNGPKAKADLEPAAEGDAIDDSTVKGLTKAMESGALGQADFIKRFPKLSGLEQVKKSDARAVMSWIADPQKN